MHPQPARPRLTGLAALVVGVAHAAGPQMIFLTATALVYLLMLAAGLVLRRSRPVAGCYK